VPDKFEDDLAHTIETARSQGSLGQPNEPKRTKHWSEYSGPLWTLRFGTFERCGDVNPDGASRFVHIENCTITKGRSIGDRKFFNEVFCGCSASPSRALGQAGDLVLLCRQFDEVIDIVGFFENGAFLKNHVISIRYLLCDSVVLGGRAVRAPRSRARPAPCLQPRLWSR
jgi:hypothetical protein